MNDRITTKDFADEIAPWLTHFNVAPHFLSIEAGLSGGAVSHILRRDNVNDRVLKTTESKIRAAMEKLHPTTSPKYVRSTVLVAAKKKKNYPSDGLPQIQGEALRIFKGQVLRFLKNNPDISVGQLSRAAGLGNDTLAGVLRSNDTASCRSVTAARAKDAMKALNARKLDKSPVTTPSPTPEILSKPPAKHRIADLENMSRDQLILLILKMQDLQP